MRTWTKRDPVKNYFPLPNEIYQLGLCSATRFLRNSDRIIEKK